MSTLILHAFATYALWYGLSSSSLPGWWQLRQWLSARSTVFTEWVLCPLCSGFWASTALAIGQEVLLPEFQFTNSVAFSVFVKGLFGACACFLIEKQVARMEGR